ncbi:DNA alkylation repair protein [Sphingobacteriaceae bacterium]|nr:DNA alkylation repair protein [Sphingobacteriaceae bacterium]
MEPLKEMFNLAYYENLAKEFSRADKNFNSKKFLKEVTENIKDLSLNQRMRRTSETLKNNLPSDYKKSLDILERVIPNTRGGYTNLVFPDFVGLYGHDHFDLSMEALKYFTTFGSSEFAIREFLKRDFSKTIKVMQTWAKDKNAHVRRLSSEGSRPRLPWSFKLDEVIKNPAVTKTILETLKEDDELYVRKSVANHLNDITKENAGYMLDLVNSWNKKHPHTAWIIKHASRSLIKKGHAGSLSVFDYEKNVKVRVENFKLSKSKITLGESLTFEFDLISEKTKDQKLVVDYIIHYKKKSGDLSAKVFKLKDVELKAKETIHISKSQTFKDFTTRKHFAGIHEIEIQVNGKVLAKNNFTIFIS